MASSASADRGHPFIDSASARVSTAGTRTARRPRGETRWSPRGLEPAREDPRRPPWTLGTWTRFEFLPKRINASAKASPASSTPSSTRTSSSASSRLSRRRYLAQRGDLSARVRSISTRTVESSVSSGAPEGQRLDLVHLRTRRLGRRRARLAELPPQPAHHGERDGCRRRRSSSSSSSSSFGSAAAAAARASSSSRSSSAHLSRRRVLALLAASAAMTLSTSRRSVSVRVQRPRPDTATHAAMASPHGVASSGIQVVGDGAVRSEPVHPRRRA